MEVISNQTMLANTQISYWLQTIIKSWFPIGSSGLWSLVMASMGLIMEDEWSMMVTEQRWSVQAPLPWEMLSSPPP